MQQTYFVLEFFPVTSALRSPKNKLLVKYHDGMIPTAGDVAMAFPFDLGKLLPDSPQQRSFLDSAVIDLSSNLIESCPQKSRCPSQFVKSHQRYVRKRQLIEPIGKLANDIKAR